MWDLALMTIFIKHTFYNHPLYVGYSSSQYETDVLQTPPLKLITFSSGPRNAMLQYHMTWHY
jgi:hypothetical protein